MKKGLMIGLIVIVIIVIGIFIYFLSFNSYNPKTNSNVGNLDDNAGTRDDDATPLGNAQVSDPTMPTTPSTTAPPSAETFNVNIDGFAFSPDTINIKKGDTVIWTNKDSASHTITSSSGSELSSSSLSKGGTYSHTFENSGTYDYHCNIHPSMKAKVIVT